MAERDTWELTREMFLDEAEVQAVRESLQSAIEDADETTVDSRRVDRVIFEILVLSGLRNSEFCRLRVADTPAALGQPFLRVAETPRQNRLVAIPATLVTLIADYIVHLRPRLPRDASQSDDFSQTLILNERKRAFDRTALYRRVVRILTAAGLGSRASVQLLRHTYGYLAYKRTQGNLLFVQQQLGHSHPMVTAVYAEFVDFSKSELADLVAGEPASQGAQSTSSSTLESSRPNRKKGKQA